MRITLTAVGVPLLAKHRENMDFQLLDVLKMIGATASVVFALWIYKGLFQQRYAATYARFCSLVNEDKQYENSKER